MATKKNQNPQGEPLSEEILFVMNQFSDQIENAFSRISLLKEGGRSGDDRRDINSECGYPEKVDASTFREYYDRHDVAGRVVNFFPDECFRVQPEVYETEDEEETEFEKTLSEIGRSLMGGSKFEAQRGNSLFHYIHRIDRESGIGRFGLLLIGIDDGISLDQPVLPKKGRKIIYLRCFSEEKVVIKEVDRNENSPRFGHPVLYEITFDSDGGPSVSEKKQKLVHWTRVVHITDNRSGSEIYGTARMRPVFDRLYDIRKILGSSGEGCWSGSIQKLFFKRQSGYEDAPALTPDQKEEMRRDIYRFFQSLQRYMNLTGLEAYAIPPAVVDPNPHLEAHIKMICVRMGIPYRKFIGSEEARLASEQDKTNTDDLVRHRQETYLSPMVIAPIIDRFIMLGVLPEPQQYYIYWPELTAPSREDKARVAGLIIDALSKYQNGNVAQILYLADFLSIAFGGLFTDEEIEQIVDNALAHADEFSPEPEEEEEEEQENSFGRTNED